MPGDLNFGIVDAKSRSALWVLGDCTLTNCAFLPSKGTELPSFCSFSGLSTMIRMIHNAMRRLQTAQAAGLMSSVNRETPMRTESLSSLLPQVWNVRRAAAQDLSRDLISRKESGERQGLLGAPFYSAAISLSVSKRLIPAARKKEGIQANTSFLHSKPGTEGQEVQRQKNPTRAGQGHLDRSCWPAHLPATSGPP